VLGHFGWRTKNMMKDAPEKKDFEVLILALIPSLLIAF
jgi:hypothetical protein